MPDYTSVQWQSSALLVIDVQQDFVDGAFPVPGTSTMLPALRRLVEAYRLAARPVVHVVRFYPAGGSDVDTVRRAMVEAGARIAVPHSDGARIPAILTADESLDLPAEQLMAGEIVELGPGEVVLWKPRWSAFHRTALAGWLQERQITSVVVAGCNLPNCPRATLFDASARDLRTALVSDAVSNTTPQRLADVELIGVTVVDVDTVLGELARP